MKISNIFANLIAKYEFWRAKSIKLDKDYQIFYDGSDPEAIAFKMLKKYPDVIVSFSNIKLNDDSMMQFDFTVIANPNLCNVESTKFKQFTSDIFRNILVESIKNSRDQNENGTFNFVESAEERTVHEEVTAVSQERVSERKPRKKAVRGNKAIRSKV
jgi:hypothetical protein